MVRQNEACIGEGNGDLEQTWIVFVGMQLGVVKSTVATTTIICFIVLNLVINGGRNVDI